jgi:O-antigen ligase
VIWLVLGTEQDGLFSSISRTGEAHEVYELNGRTELWPRVLAKISESPIFGFGHGCQRFVIPSLGISWANYHAHNMLLHVMLGLGVIGGMLLLMSLLNMLFLLVARPATFPDMVTLFLLCGGIADSMIFSPVPDATSFIWILALSWRYAARRQGLSLQPPGEERPWAL